MNLNNVYITHLNFNHCNSNNINLDEQRKVK